MCACCVSWGPRASERAGERVHVRGGPQVDLLLSRHVIPSLVRELGLGGRDLDIPLADIFRCAVAVRVVCAARCSGVVTHALLLCCMRVHACA